MKKLLYIFIFSAFALSCGDLRETYSDYLGDGERIYVGKLSEVELLPGYQRMIVKGETTFMKTANKCIIELLEIGKTYTAEVNPSLPEFSYQINDLAEGNYYVKITSMDRNGNISVSETYNVDVYGPESVDSYYPKRVTDMKFDLSDGSIKLIWNQADNVEQVALTYQAEDGTTCEMIVEGGAPETKLLSWKASTEVTATSKVRPREGALDLIALPTLTYSLPDDPIIEVPRSTFSNADMLSDAIQGYGGSVDKMWDNQTWDYNHGYHTADGVGIPHHITIDMGITATLTECQISFTGYDRTDWMARQFQIWGIGDVENLDDHEADVPSNHEGFEASALAKGWVKLTEENIFVSRWMPNIKFTLTRTEDIRYIRYRVVEALSKPGYTGPDAYGSASEINLWGLGRKIKPIE